MIFIPGGPGLPQCPTYTLKRSSKGRTSVKKVKKPRELTDSENREGTRNNFNRGGNGLRDVRENNREAQILRIKSWEGPAYTKKEKSPGRDEAKIWKQVPSADLTTTLMNSMNVEEETADGAAICLGGRTTTYVQA